MPDEVLTRFLNQDTSLDVQKIAGTPATAAARLCNFVTNKSDLLPAHKDYLSTDVKKAIENFLFPWVEIVGYASRRGRSEANLRLSKERMQAVGLFIADMGKKCEFVKSIGVGSEQSGEDAKDNSGYYRAVEVYIYGTKPPVRPDLPPEAKPIANQYKMRFCGGVSTGLGPIAVDILSFEIADIVRKISAIFAYAGPGLTFQIPVNLPTSGSLKGPWSKTFRTTRPTLLSTFEGLATVTSEPGATVGNASINGAMHLEFPERSDNDGPLKTRPGVIKVEGGAGLQLSAGSATVGYLSMKGKPTGWAPGD